MATGVLVVVGFTSVFCVSLFMFVCFFCFVFSRRDAALCAAWCNVNGLLVRRRGFDRVAASSGATLGRSITAPSSLSDRSISTRAVASFSTPRTNRPLFNGALYQHRTRRVVQLGLKGKWLQTLGSGDAVVRIERLDGLLAEQRAALASSEPQNLTVPVARPLDVGHLQVRADAYVV